MGSDLQLSLSVEIEKSESKSAQEKGRKKERNLPAILLQETGLGSVFKVLLKVKSHLLFTKIIMNCLSAYSCLEVWRRQEQ